MFLLQLIMSLLFTVMPPCATEDSNNCAWDAHGQGHSFVTIGDNIWYVN